MDSAREIRLDHSPTHTGTHTRTTVRLHSGKNTLVAQLGEHTEPWPLQTCLALVKTCAVDSVGQLLVPLIRRCDVRRDGPINGAGVFFFLEEVAPSQGPIWPVPIQLRRHLCAHCAISVHGGRAPLCSTVSSKLSKRARDRLIQTLSDGLIQILAGVIWKM